MRMKYEVSGEGGLRAGVVYCVRPSARSEELREAARRVHTLSLLCYVFLRRLAIRAAESSSPVLVLIIQI
jgi:hypothetical protein